MPPTHSFEHNRTLIVLTPLQNAIETSVDQVPVFRETAACCAYKPCCTLGCKVAWISSFAGNGNHFGKFEPEIS